MNLLQANTYHQSRHKTQMYDLVYLWDHGAVHYKKATQHTFKQLQDWDDLLARKQILYKSIHILVQSP